MATINEALVDSHGRPLQDAVVEDSSGNKYVLRSNSSGQPEVVLVTGTSEIGSLAEGSNTIGAVTGVPFSVAEEQEIDASLGAFVAGEVVGADDCCTTLAVAWEWDVALAAGGYVLISNIDLINETENQAVQYDWLLFNATPTGDLRSNAANDNPVKADYAKWLCKVSMPASTAEGATVATYTSAYPGDGVSGLPRVVKCAAGSTKIYGVLLTNTAYTQTDGDIIRAVMSGEAYL